MPKDPLQDFDPWDTESDVPDPLPGILSDALAPLVLVPSEGVTLPDGRSATVNGDLREYEAGLHSPGDNSLGLNETEGLLACESILRPFHVTVSEDDLARYAPQQAFCDSQGRVPPELLAQVLTDFGIPGRFQVACDVSELAMLCELGQGLLVAVSSEALDG